MTRVNVVPPQILLDQHLRAELREIPRVITLARHGAKIPPKYTLGTGHVTFFYDKLGYILRRIIALDIECKRRGFKGLEMAYLAQITESVYRSSFNKDWTPSEEDVKLNMSRIIERYCEKPTFYLMCSKNIDYLKFIKDEKNIVRGF